MGGRNGVKKYTTGKKDVKCELFLDFGVFDEHTCRAEASVCWDTGGPKTTAAPADADASAAAPAAAPKAAPKAAPAAKPAPAPKAKSASAE